MPPEYHKQTEKRAREAEAHTFEKLANEWYAYSAPRWAEATAYKARLYPDNDIIPGIGKRPVGEITRPEVVELARKVEARGTLNAAGKIRQWLNQIFRFGMAKGLVSLTAPDSLSSLTATILVFSWQSAERNQSPPCRHLGLVLLKRQLAEFLAGRCRARPTDQSLIRRILLKFHTKDRG